MDEQIKKPSTKKAKKTNDVPDDEDNVGIKEGTTTKVVREQRTKKIR